MECLLCHKKIPRLRAWRTKSDFCSDECAAQYKSQTLERLLTRDDEESESSVPLPIEEPAPDDLDVSTADLPAEGGAAESTDLARLFDEHDAGVARKAPESPPPAHNDFENDDLWSLTEGATLPPAFPDSAVGATGVDSQSAEDALEALRQLAAGRETENAEESAPDPPLASAESDEIRELSAALPEPEFGSGMDLLEQNADESSEEWESGSASMLARLTEDADLGEPTPEESADVPDGQRSAAEEGPARQDPDAPLSAASSRVEVEELAIELEPTDDDFMGGMEAAFEAIEAVEGAEDTHESNVVPFPGTVDEAADSEDIDRPQHGAIADEDGGADGELILEGLSEPPSDGGDAPELISKSAEEAAAVETVVAPESVPAAREEPNSGTELDAEEDPLEARSEPEEAEVPPENEATENIEPQSARKAPRLRPAMVMAGLFPTASGGDEPAVTEWAALKADAQVGAAPVSAPAAGPLLNGLGAPLAAAERLLPARRDSSLEVGLRAAIPAAGQVAPRFPRKPVCPAPRIVLPEAQTDDLTTSALLQPASEPLTLVLKGAEPVEDGGDSADHRGVLAPAAPEQRYYDAVSEFLVDASSDEDAEWFTDIEGFESL